MAPREPVDVLCLGHASFDQNIFVDGYPAENSKCEITHLLECGGGPAANAAYLLCFWGASSAFAGVVGNDRYGAQIESEFEFVGTDISLLEIRSGHNTPFSVIVVNRENASRTIINRKVPAAPLWLDAEIARPLAPKLLLFDGHELEASLQALDLFPDALSLLDAGSIREGTRELASRVDYLAASERFALQATGLPNLSSEANRKACVSALNKLFAPQGLIVTLGERGLVAECGTQITLPAFPAVAVDTTGAGDIFHGAFAYALVKGLGFDGGLKLASMAASLSVQKAGGRTSIPTLQEVQEALDAL
jgi:sulfofructose kinase